MILRALWRRLRALVTPKRVERDLNDEMTSHLAFEVNRLVRSGVPEREARRLALARFGSVAATTDACREVWRVRFVAETVADLRYAIRRFRQRPIVTLAMAAVLAIGIGCSTVVFILISSFASAPLAGIDAADDVVRIRGIDRSRGPGRARGRELPYGEVRAYAAETSVFQAVEAWTSADVVLDLGDGQPNLQSGAATFVTAGYFGVLGAQPVRGAGLPASFADDGPPLAMGVISHAIWERFYGASEAVLGRTLKVNDVTIAIVGVAPRGFVGARPGGSVSRVWLPLNARPLLQPSAPRLVDDAAIFGVLARLQARVSQEQATAAVSAIADRFAARGSTAGPGVLATDVVPVLATTYFPPSGEPSSAAGRLLSLTMPLIVLLMTCTSISALLAGQAIARGPEMAVRLAMGAHRPRILRQLLTETTLLGLLAGALALAVIWWMLAGAELAILGSGASLVLDWRVVAFTAGLALVASVAFGLSPALHATRATVSDVLKAPETGRGRTRLQATLVVAQIALTQPALLMMGTLLLDLREELRDHAPATAADRLLEVGFNTNPRYGALDNRREDAIARVRARIEALPGVAGAVPMYEAAGGRERVASLPGDRAGGRPGDLDRAVRLQPAPEGYFEAMGVRVTEGRAFRPSDRNTTDSAIVNRALARGLWGAAPALGRRLRFERTDRDSDPHRAPAMTVVGIVDDNDAPTLFQPSSGRMTSHLLVRTLGPADAAVPAIRAAAFGAAPETPITTMRTLASIEAEARRDTTRGVMVAGASGMVALVLAAVGLYAVVAVAVGQRRREIAVRTALGADARRITRLFMMRGLRLCGIGAALGLGASLVALNLLAAVQGEPVAPDLAVLVAGVTAFVMTVALVATWIPARQATGVDTLAALRTD
jgi:predicted permease